MPAFTYEALDTQGTPRKGTLEADSAKAARSLLRAQGLVPLQVEPVQASAAATPGSWDAWLTRPVLSPTALAVWTRQLAGLVSSGLPLERALHALAEEAENERMHLLLAALRAEVNAGSSLAQALSQHPREFPSVYQAVVAAGEAGGQLGTVLLQLADDQEARLALRAKVIGAALYPAIVTVLALVIVLFLVGYVVPQVAGVFASSQQALPWITRLMMAISSGVRSYGLPVSGLLAVALVLGAQLLRQPAWREKWDAAWLRLPLIGRLARHYHAAQFASTLGLLIGSGVPILKALQSAAQTLGNTAMRADALDAMVLVREGAPLATALAQKRRFPTLVSMFSRLGEQTGALPAMLQRAARQLSDEVQRRALHLATILEPALIVAMGLIVMAIVMAVLLPIIELNQLVK